MLKRAMKYYLLLNVGLLFAVGVQAENTMSANKTMLSYTCAGCHGPNGVSVGSSIPSIGGQTKIYLISVLLGYKYHDAPDKLEEIAEQKKYEDFEFFPRYSIIMSRLMAGYTLEEIELIAEYFSAQKWQPATQTADSALARSGDKLHDSACEKCHEDGGTSTADDASILAGQWMPYLQHSLSDYHEGRNKMPKKMKKKLKEVHAKYGVSGFEKLVHFYGSQ